jgi:hypothetical protein
MRSVRKTENRSISANHPIERLLPLILPVISPEFITAAAEAAKVASVGTVVGASGGRRRRGVPMEPITMVSRSSPEELGDISGDDNIIEETCSFMNRVQRYETLDDYTEGLPMDINSIFYEGPRMIRTKGTTKGAVALVSLRSLEKGKLATATSSNSADEEKNKEEEEENPKSSAAAARTLIDLRFKKREEGGKIKRPVGRPRKIIATEAIPPPLLFTTMMGLNLSSNNPTTISTPTTSPSPTTSIQQQVSSSSSQHALKGTKRPRGRPVERVKIQGVWYDIATGHVWVPRKRLPVPTLPPPTNSFSLKKTKEEEEDEEFII